MGYKRPQESASKCRIQFDFLAFYRYCFEIEKKVNLRHSSFALNHCISTICTVETTQGLIMTDFIKSRNQRHVSVKVFRPQHQLYTQTTMWSSS